MKSCLLFPPQWSPLSPHCAPTSIAAQLKNAGHTVFIRDLNLEFYKFTLNQEYVNKSIKKALEIEPVLKSEVTAAYSKIEDFNELSQDFKVKAKKYLKIKELSENIKEIEEIIKYLPTAVETLKHKDDFYSLNLFSKSIAVIDKALYLNSLPYYPGEFSLHDFTISNLKF